MRAWIATALAVTGACSMGPPNTIDVSAYPRDMQGRYELFLRKCTRCHGLDRPLQARVGARGWDDYVHRMARHPGAGISEAEQREIAAFLQFHAQREAERSK
jgi:cytochrome c2